MNSQTCIWIRVSVFQDICIAGERGSACVIFIMEQSSIILCKRRSLFMQIEIFPFIGHPITESLGTGVIYCELFSDLVLSTTSL